MTDHRREDEKGNSSPVTHDPSSLSLTSPRHAITLSSRTRKSTARPRPFLLLTVSFGVGTWERGRARVPASSHVEPTMFCECWQ